MDMESSYTIEEEEEEEEETPNNNSPTSKKRSAISAAYSPNPPPVTIKEILLLSPPPPPPPPPYNRKPRPRPIVVADELAVVEYISQQQQQSSVLSTPPPSRRRGGSRATGVSPRNVRRGARRRLEKSTDIGIAKEVVEKDNIVLPSFDPSFEDEKGGGGGGGGGRVIRKSMRRQTTRPKHSQKDTLLSLLVPPSSSIDLSSTPLPVIGNDESNQSTDTKWEMINELVMWKNVAKSTLWFGMGSMFFISSSFSRDFNFSLISAVSHLAILILGLAFFYDSVPQRQLQKHSRGGAKFQLTEENILRTARLVLPMANGILAQSQELFSGEPLMTLKVAPILLFTAKYGHLITPWRLLATGFFLSFTIPKVYSCYSEKIHTRVEETKNYVMEAWKSCPRKNLVAASTAMVLWNLFSVKTRISAVFISVVVLRYHRRHHIESESDAK